MNLKFWTYLLIYLFSSILNLVFFFKVLRLPLRKRHFLVLIFLILINILASGFNYLAIVFSELITIVFLWLIFKKKISSYSILGAILFVFNVEVVGDICRAILLDVTVKVIKDIKLIMLSLIHILKKKKNNTNIPTKTQAAQIRPKIYHITETSHPIHTTER
ncbi:hypothetical protein CBF78_00605 [Lactobacillus taiwanensis]|nr:hypothetical protein CBF78_00605 [Lactobacillus taiwanensis]